MGLWLVSGLFLALTCRDSLRAERLCVWIFLQAAFALLAAILAGRAQPGAWPMAAHVALYGASATAVLGAVAHVNALRVQARLRQKLSTGQSLSQMADIDDRLRDLGQGKSERFLSVYQAEATNIELLKEPGLLGLWRQAEADPDRPGRLRSQSRYLDYREQVAFGKIARLLLQKEQLLVHVAPHLKRSYVLNVWCDAQVCLFAVTLGLLSVQWLIRWYY